MNKTQWLIVLGGGVIVALVWMAYPTTVYMAADCIGGPCGMPEHWIDPQPGSPAYAKHSFDFAHLIPFFFQPVFRYIAIALVAVATLGLAVRFKRATEVPTGAVSLCLALMGVLLSWLICLLIPQIHLRILAAFYVQRHQFFLQPALFIFVALISALAGVCVGLYRIQPWTAKAGAALSLAVLLFWAALRY